MHILHNYIAHNLADHLRKARVVVWYDPPPRDFRALRQIIAGGGAQ